MEGSEQNTTAGYIAGKRGFPLVSLDQVTDEKLRRVLAQHATSATSQESTVAAEAVSDVLQEAAADMGITAQEPVEPTCDPELTPNGHGARTVIDPSLVPDHELDAYREDPNPRHLQQYGDRGGADPTLPAGAHDRYDSAGAELSRSPTLRCGSCRNAEDRARLDAHHLRTAGR